MSFCRVLSAGSHGIEAFRVEVEVDVADGLPGFDLIGLPDSSVREARERVRSALQNSGFSLPSSRYTVNLAPAPMRKEGSGFDLPIALAVMIACQGDERDSLWREALVVGELSLDGSLRPVPGILAMAMFWREQGGSRLLVPLENAPEAALVPGLEVIGCSSLLQVIACVRNDGSPPFQAFTGAREVPPTTAGAEGDLAEVRGQEQGRRALEIAAAGGHNLVFVGPPGSGKTMLAQRLPGILPPLDFDSALEVTRIFSVRGLLDHQEPLITNRPFRAVHHTVSYAGLVGGGRPPLPGEVSLAHRGVLYLDELPEFNRDALETLRQPLEQGHIRLTRAGYSLVYPALFTLVASMNPCPCGYLGDSHHQCSCLPGDVRRYRSRVSGPLLDRLDLHVELPRVRYNELTGSNCGESSYQVRQRVLAAIERQRQRGAEENAPVNAHLTPRQVRHWCLPAPDGQNLLERAYHNLGLSARAYQRVLKLSRTVADLAGEPDIKAEHVAEVLQYRQIERVPASS